VPIRTDALEGGSMFEYDRDGMIARRTTFFEGG
jgi:hypothetical protein